MAASARPSVVIVGAGPSGLSLAIELGSRGVPCLLLERNERAGYAPRAKTTHTRTREHLRRWGIADKLGAAAPFGLDYPSNVVFCTRLAGEQIARFENALFCAPGRDARYAEHAQWIPQYKLEAVLLEHVRTLPAISVSFGQEFLSLEQDGGGVRVRIRDVATGDESLVETDYLVGADGSRSSVREQLGFKMLGAHGLSRNYNTVFSAPGLADAHSQGPGIMYWQLNSEVPSLIGPMDAPDLWYFMPTGIPDGVKYSKDEVLELIRRSTGIDLPYKILSSDEWTASRVIAEHYARGRVFLVGDACHLNPPFGGYGMNMGVADSVDLGWKLAAVLEGWGGDGLLASYEIERRAADEFALDEAQANHSLSPNQLARPQIEERTDEGAKVREEVAELIWQTKTAEFYSLGVVLGFCYRGSPIIVDDGSQTLWERSREYKPSATPGCRAPHTWLDDGQSLFDLFGSGFTLLALETGLETEVRAAEASAAKMGIPLTTVTIPNEHLRALYEGKLALIRPDQHVAWRGAAWPGDKILTVVTGRSEP